MRKALAVVGAALVASVAANTYQALPSSAPPKPVYVQRVVQLLEATNAGRWKEACDAAPTAAYSYNDFAQLALMYGARSYADLPKLCVALLRGAATKLDNKTPIGLSYEILYYTPDDGKASASTDRLVIVDLHWNGAREGTVVFHVQLARLWEKKTAKCGKKQTPCAPLRWYVLGAT